MARSNSITSLSSISSRSSRSPSAEPVETMQIFIKDVAGETFPLTIPQSTSVSTLRKLLALRTNLPETDFRVVYAGKHLSSSDSLASCNVLRESTLHMALPIRGGAPKKIRCGAKDCKDAAQRIVGDCGFCQGHFCGKHRMLEAHSCAGLEQAKQEDKDRNTAKLQSERTTQMKGIGAA